MNKLIVNNEVEMPCERVLQNGEDRMDVHFFVDYPIVDALEVFKDNVSLIVTWEDGMDRNYSRFKILKSITYNSEGSLDVCYKMLSPLEQIIELHYGGVKNNEGSI